MYSDDEDGLEARNGAQNTKPHKRARTEEAEEPVEDVNVDVEEEEEVEIEAEEDDAEDDTRFLPPELRKKKQVGGSGSRNKSNARRTASKKKRAVVLSDEDEEEGYNTAEQDAMLQDGDEDFVPDATSSKRGASHKGKAKSSKLARGTGAADIPTRAEGRLSAAASRGASAGDDDFDDHKSESRTISSKDPTPPPPKRPKLPPIKKKQPSNTPVATPSTAKQPAKPTPQPPKADLALPVPGTRKPAATANNADFDLRDASVYASLFAKVCIYLIYLIQILTC